MTKIIEIMVLAMTLATIGIGECKVMTTQGKLLTEPHMTCNITVGDMVINDYEPGNGLLIFGLIEYECGNEKGAITSDKECVPCVLYCPENDLIKGCEHYYAPLVIGVLVGGMLAITMKKMIKSIRSKMTEVKLRRKAARVESRRAKIATILMDLKTDDNADKTDAIYPDLPLPEASAPVYRNDGPSAIGVATIGLLASGSGMVYACDRTLYMNSLGSVCENNACEDITTIMFTLRTGSNVCFINDKNEIVKFTLDRTEINTYYNALYHTSDVTLKSESFSRCKQTGECYHETCHMGYKHESFISNNASDGYSCYHEGLGCDYMCFHKYACTWVHWWLVPVGPLGTVYRKEYTWWSINLGVDVNGNKQVLQLDVNRPTNEFISLIGGKSIKVPVSIEGFMSEQTHRPDYIFKNSELTIETDASALNNPIVGQIGEVQIDLFNRDIIYPVDGVKCVVSGCIPKCAIASSAISRISTSSMDNFASSYDVGERNVISHRMVNANVKIAISNIKFNSLLVERAYCKVEMVSSYGCIGCNVSPYVVLSANNIVRPGLVKITSNCTTKHDYISCSNKMYKLDFIGTPAACSIYAESINVSLSFNLNYTFVGGLTIQSSIFNDNTDTGYLIKGMLTNDGFITGICSTIATITSMTLIISGLSRLVTRLLMLRTAEKVKEDL